MKKSQIPAKQNLASEEGDEKFGKYNIKELAFVCIDKISRNL